MAIHVIFYKFKSKLIKLPLDNSIVKVASKPPIFDHGIFLSFENHEFNDKV